MMKPKNARFNVIGQLAALRRYARSLTRDEGEAEDLVHDTLVRAYERRRTFQPDRSLKAWLLSVLHNAFIDGVRGRRAESVWLARAAELAHNEAPPAQDHAVRLTQVRQAFMTLPDEQREALHLVALEGLSYQEAAATLSIPLGTLMSRLSRARAALRAMEEPSAASAEQHGASPSHLRVVGGSHDPTA
jgi:RNA polymerase sigma-70 factor (ECF subfamily)